MKLIVALTNNTVGTLEIDTRFLETLLKYKTVQIYLHDENGNKITRDGELDEVLEIVET